MSQGRFGAHMSIAGGHHNAVTAALKVGCDTFQVFTKGNQQWAAAPLSDAMADQFKAQASSSAWRMAVLKSAMGRDSSNKRPLM